MIFFQKELWSLKLILKGAVWYIWQQIGCLRIVHAGSFVNTCPECRNPVLSTYRYHHHCKHHCAVGVGGGGAMNGYFISPSICTKKMKKVLRLTSGRKKNKHRTCLKSTNQRQHHLDSQNISRTELHHGSLQKFRNSSHNSSNLAHENNLVWMPESFLIKITSLWHNQNNPTNHHRSTHDSRVKNPS